jgi:uncharacterized membrane protein YcaP (DUF421 family)
MINVNLLQASADFSWKEFLMGSEEWSFLGETVLRSFVMFVVILVSLRILGKRGVKQLSVFELVVIIGLGSAAGDPMFYKDVGILPAIIVFVMVVSLYSVITYLVGTNKKFEALVEGRPVCLIKNGVFSIDNFKKEVLGEDEFFAELRIASVSQLGQIEEAILESSGQISIFYFPDGEVKYGLPILPNMLEKAYTQIEEKGHHSCIFCGYTTWLEITAGHTCPLCKKKEWIAASNKKRIR